MSSPVAEPGRPGALVVRAIVPGLAFAAVAGTAAVASGGLPDGTTPFVVAGCATAALTGAFGAALKARAIAKGGDGSDAAQRLQIAIFGDFVIQLFAVGGTMLAMFLSDLKFERLGGFALAFATVALGHQFGSSFVLARALRRRAARGGGAGNACSGQEAPSPEREARVQAKSGRPERLDAAAGSASSPSGSSRR